MIARKIIVFVSLGLISWAVGFLFYQQEIQYWLPTPIPQNYKVVNIGETIKSFQITSNKKKFIHFYNPTCPCSKFNLTNYKSLIKDYHESFDCYAVIQNHLDGIDPDDVSYLEKLGVKLIVDKNKKLAQACGVYATPQIVLLNEKNELYYRGNYNRARYCTSPATNYAKIAIDSMLSDQFYIFPVEAATAYGCDLERHTH